MMLIVRATFASVIAKADLWKKKPGPTLRRQQFATRSDEEKQEETERTLAHTGDSIANNRTKLCINSIRTTL